ncbi:hypothetical protein D9756_001161 [Leucocoprinus leucothites]|uniref:Cytochrome P450 n=1 Tax=Leucocoprinus leucothites TaxID=201217 RepID=A0A8H5G4I2_9AGAR|nr:hypothetical protein D9756_001161 [Leucoagaricus leucothites]
MINFALPVAISLTAVLGGWGLLTRIALLLKTLPPGPSLLTRIIENRGNEPLAVKLKRWSQQYGDVISLMDFVHIGKPTIVLSTPKAAVDLLEKRGNIYSSRPRNIFAAEVAYRGAKGTLLPMGTKLRRFRTTMSATLSNIPSRKYRLLEDPETKLMLRAYYKKQIQENIGRTYKDPYTLSPSAQHSDNVLTTSRPAMWTSIPLWRSVTDVLCIDGKGLFTIRVSYYPDSRNLPGSRLVDHLPILSRLPFIAQWLCREAEEHGAIEERFFRNCIDQAKLADKSGTALSGSSWHTLERQERFGYTDLDVALLSSAPYTAGVTTTLGACDALLLAILLYPSVMRRAQDEIDAVVGPDRLPDFQDFDTLKYIRAMIKETLRWHPFLPLGIPHAATEDDVYEGMFIPAGSTVIANIYAITRDTELFPDPEEFKPERFMDATDPLLKNFNMSFGFGRRICPGQYVATDQLFIMISRILWAFDVRPLKGGPSPLAKHGNWGQVASLSYELIPRSDHIRSLVIDQAVIAEDDVKAWKNLSY